MSFDALLKRAKGDLEAAETFRSSVVALLESDHDALVTALKQDPVAVHSYLCHPHATLRYLALTVVDGYWHLDERFQKRVEQLAIGDPDPKVRGCALNSLKAAVSRISHSLTHTLVEHLLRDEGSNDDQLLRSLRDALREGEAVIAEHAEWSARLAKTKHSILQSLAGDDASSMGQSPEIASSYLSSDDPSKRVAALSVLRTVWPDWQPSLVTYSRVMMNDQSLEVREVAAECLVGLCSGTGDPRIGKLFASIVYDESIPVSLRAIAYNGLFELRGLPQDVWPSVRELEEGGVFPDDVDWNFVESFSVE